MSEFAREAVLASVEAAGRPKVEADSDLAGLAIRMRELDRLLNALKGILGQFSVRHEHEFERLQAAQPE
jgi:hypothetical protein